MRRGHVGDGVMRGDVAQEAKSPRLVPAFAAPASECHRAIGAGASVLDLLREQKRLAEM